MGPAWDARRHAAEALARLPELEAWAAPLRRDFAALAAAHDVPFTDNLRDPYAWVVYVHYTELVARLVGDRGARIVDWGAGYGHVTQLLRARGFTGAQAYHVYPPAHYAPFQERFGLPSLYGKDPNALALPDASVDALLSSGVLEHVREDGVGREEAVLAEVARVLKPGGLFMAWNLPTLAAPADLLGKLRGHWHHAHRYRRRDVLRLLRGAGLELAHVEHHGGTPLGVALKLLGAPPWKAFAWDHRLAQVPPFAWLAQNFAVVARKPQRATPSDSP